MSHTTEDEPIEVYSLSEYLCEEMQARGWRSGDVARRMGGSTEREQSINQLAVELLLAVQDERLKSNQKIFAQLDAAFGVSDGFFNGLYDLWLKWPDRRVPFETPDDLFGPPLLRPTP